jgi:hypothetical protein
MVLRFGESTHVPKKDGTYVVFEKGDGVPQWARSRFGSHVPTYEESDQPAAVVDERLETVRTQAKDLGLDASGDDVTVLQAAIDAALQRRADEAEAGTANADLDDDALRTKLTEIGQSTDGDHDELVARLNEHEG